MSPLGSRTNSHGALAKGESSAPSPVGPCGSTSVAHHCRCIATTAASTTTIVARVIAIRATAATEVYRGDLLLQHGVEQIRGRVDEHGEVWIVGLEGS